MLHIVMGIAHVCGDGAQCVAVFHGPEPLRIDMVSEENQGMKPTLFTKSSSINLIDFPNDFFNFN